MRIKLLFIILILFSINIAEAKTVTFAQAADVHYSVFYPNNPPKNTYNSPEALKGFVKRVNEKNYDFVVFLGDNIDKSKEKNLISFLKIIKPIKPPYYIVLGNKDAHKDSGMTKQQYIETVLKYNKNQKTADGNYYFYPASGFIAIVLDGLIPGIPNTHGAYNQKTLKWLDELLTKNKNKKALIFQHFPYLPPYDSPAYEILDKNIYTELLSKHNNILLISSGHYHKEKVVKTADGIYHISAPALYIAPYNYQEIQINYDKRLFKKAKNFELTIEEFPAI